jgi:hypothetical protein
MRSAFGNVSCAMQHPQRNRQHRHRVGLMDEGETERHAVEYRSDSEGGLRESGEP